MTPVTGMGPTCCVHACLRPVREFGQLCTAHWQGLSAAQRAALEFEQPTEELDPDRLQECVALEALLAIEWADDEHPEAA